MNDTRRFVYSLEVISEPDLCRAWQLNILQLPEGSGCCIVPIHKLLSSAIVRQVVDVQVCLDCLLVADVKRTTNENVPLQKPWAPDLTGTAILVLKAVCSG